MCSNIFFVVVKGKQKLLNPYIKWTYKYVHWMQYIVTWTNKRIKLYETSEWIHLKWENLFDALKISIAKNE